MYKVIYMETDLEGILKKKEFHNLSLEKAKSIMIHLFIDAKKQFPKMSELKIQENYIFFYENKKSSISYEIECAEEKE